MPRKPNAPTDTRQTLLQAANRVIAKDGVVKLTLESVAAEAHTSKGGLLYHFPSKRALLHAMLEGYFAPFEAALAASDDGTPGAFCKAFLRHSVTPSKNPTEHALLAAIVLEPELLQLTRQHYAHWQKRLENDGVDAATASVLRLALDGWYMASLLGLAMPKPALQKRIAAKLLLLVEDNLLEGDLPKKKAHQKTSKGARA